MKKITANEMTRKDLQAIAKDAQQLYYYESDVAEVLSLALHTEETYTQAQRYEVLKTAFDLFAK